mmetsp:Transcript_40554/g.90131  ORF Transcript_40554/g.90131 Transcript_40554/m.90131 type:complete len:341 (+) Transcript_40554:1950-2972(+)
MVGLRQVASPAVDEAGCGVAEGLDLGLLMLVLHVAVQVAAHVVHGLIVGAVLQLTVLQADQLLVPVQLVDANDNGGVEHVPQQALAAGGSGEGALVLVVGALAALGQQALQVNVQTLGQQVGHPLPLRGVVQDDIQKGVLHLSGHLEHDAGHTEAAGGYGAARHLRLGDHVHNVQLQGVPGTLDGVLAVGVEVELDGGGAGPLGVRPADAVKLGQHVQDGGVLVTVAGDVDLGVKGSGPLHLDGVAGVDNHDVRAVGDELGVGPAGAQGGGGALACLQTLGEVNRALGHAGGAHPGLARSISAVDPIIACIVVIPGGALVRSKGVGCCSDGKHTALHNQG